MTAKRKQLLCLALALTLVMAVLPAGTVLAHSPDTTIADFNADGTVTDSDAIYLLRHILFAQAYPVTIGTDMNTDGTTDDKDAMYLLRHVLFPQRYPLPEKLLCQYVSRAAGDDLEIYIPCTVGYCKVIFRHAVNQASNYDIWHIYRMVAVDDQLNKRYNITNTGEFEAAIRLQGRKDLSGGSNHGDEIVTDICFYIDGTPVQPETLSALTDFTQMQIRRQSTFYDPADHTTPIAEHTVTYGIDCSGVTVHQSVQWLVNETCLTSYLAMFPVLRTTADADGNTVQVSEYYTDDTSSQVYDIIEAGRSEYPQTWKQGVEKITLYSDSLGLRTSLRFTQYTQIPGAGYCQCSPAQQYNKLYFSITGFGSGTTYPVSENEVWEATAHYGVTITK